jgi:hypothetical protein
MRTLGDAWETTAPKHLEVPSKIHFFKPEFCDYRPRFFLQAKFILCWYVSEINIMQLPQKIYELVMRVYADQTPPEWIFDVHACAEKHEDLIRLCNESLDSFVARVTEMKRLVNSETTTVEIIHQHLRQHYTVENSFALYFELKQCIYLLLYLIRERPTTLNAQANNIVVQEMLKSPVQLKKCFVRIELLLAGWNYESIEKMIKLNFRETYELQLTPYINLCYTFLSNLLLLPAQDEMTVIETRRNKGRPSIPEASKQIIKELQKNKAKRNMNLIYKQSAVVSQLSTEDVEYLIHLVTNAQDVSKQPLLDTLAKLENLVKNDGVL